MFKFFSGLQNINNEKALNTSKKVKKENLTYLDQEALVDIINVAINNEKNHLNGIIIETGCALGGSALVIASAKHRDRDFYIYDVFSMIPPPSDRDDKDVHERYKIIENHQSVGLGDNLYYGYEENLYEKVAQSFQDFGFDLNDNNIHLIKGLYQDTLKISSPVALAHIDYDWFDSVWVCLERIEPHLVSGGTLILDDYYAWSGCKKAVDEYFQNKKDNYQFIQKSRLHIVKK